VSNFLNEQVWYHGSPDARDINSVGFTPRTDTTSYVPDPQKWQEVQADMQAARNAGDEDRYFELLDLAGTLQKNLTYKKPIFFTDDHRVASTYTDSQRAFDYQNSEPKLLKLDIDDSGKILRVPAHGQRFRMIGADFVRNALKISGITEEEINKYFDMFPNDIRNNKMSAETIGIIAQLLGFDIVDVLGVLDSYHGGSIKSTVRMVFDPQRIKIR